MGMKLRLTHELCVRNVEEFFMDRVTQLVDESNLEYADALHEEFVVEDEQSEEWLFINDLTNV